MAHNRTPREIADSLRHTFADPQTTVKEPSSRARHIHHLDKYDSLVTRTRLTVADLASLKGKRQLTMLRIFTIDEAAAAEAAGIDLVSAPPELVSHPRYRVVAPSLFTLTGRSHLEAGSANDHLRWAGEIGRAHV